ncbi:MAG: metal-dependent hydrolase [Candidatus Anstonellaceae archaeon]
MDWKSHLFLGVLFGAATANFVLRTDWLGTAGFAAIAGASALLPDLDIRNSKASQVLGIVALAAIVIAAGWLAVAGGKGLEEFAIYALLLLAFAFVADRLLRPRHRGVMHSLGFLCAIAAAAGLLLGGFFALAFAAGYLSHLIADKCVKLI